MKGTTGRLLAAALVLLLMLGAAGCGGRAAESGRRSEDSGEDGEDVGITLGGGDREAESGRRSEDSGEGATPAKTIPLQTILQGMFCDYGRYEEAPPVEELKPACWAIGEDEDLQRLLFLSGLELPQPDFNFGENVLLAAMLGPRNTAGYAISMLRAVQTGSEVRVEVELVEPEPGSIVAHVLTSPYHLVLARRSDFQPRGELTFTFVDSRGNILGTCSLRV